MDFPLDSEILALEELASALRPLELLTKNLCREHFTLLQADTVFQTAFNLLRRQNTHIGDSLLESLERRYVERKNLTLISCLLFLTSPLDYNPTPGDGLLHMNDLENELTALCSRLFPEPAPVQATTASHGDLDLEAGLNQATRPESQLSYAEKLASQFRDDLQNMGLKKKKTSSDVSAEIVLACKTGELTDRLQKLFRALQSIQASSVEAERAFSCAGRFVTKIRNRLGDKTLDSYCFAYHELKVGSRPVAIITFSLNTGIWFKCFKNIFILYLVYIKSISSALRIGNFFYWNLIEC